MCFFYFFFSPPHTLLFVPGDMPFHCVVGFLDSPHGSALFTVPNFICEVFYRLFFEHFLTTFFPPPPLQPKGQFSRVFVFPNLCFVRLLNGWSTKEFFAHAARPPESPCGQFRQGFAHLTQVRGPPPNPSLSYSRDQLVIPFGSATPTGIALPLPLYVAPNAFFFMLSGWFF